MGHGISGNARFGNAVCRHIASRRRPIRHSSARPGTGAVRGRWRLPARGHADGALRDGCAARGRHRPRGSGDARAGHAHRRRAAGWAALHLVELRFLEARADHGRGLRMERAPDAAHRRREGLGAAAEVPPALEAAPRGSWTHSSLILMTWEIIVSRLGMFKKLGSLSRAIRVTAPFFFFLLGSAVADDAAQPAPEYVKFGLLRERDLTPFGFLRLDMRPAHAVWAPPGNWAVEVLLGYQNTWAMSPNVEEYLKSLNGRRRLGPADVAAIRALPGEAYLVDLELGVLDVAFHRRLTEHWSVNAIFSAVNYSGGFMDGAIESFHKTFGFDSYGRPAVERNTVNVILNLKNAQTVFLNAHLDGGLLDPTFGLRYSVAAAPSPWNLVLEAAVKVPIDGQREFLSTGHTDVGLQATLQRFAGRHAAYLSAAAVRTRVSFLSGNH